MFIETLIKGEVIDKCKGKSGKVYLKVYDGKSLTAIFQSKDYDFNDVVKGDNVEIPVNVITNDCYIQVAGK